MLDYDYFKDYYKMIEIDLRKQQALNADRQAIRQINFTGTLAQTAVSKMFFIIKEAKGTVLGFSQGTVKAF